MPDPGFGPALLSWARGALRDLPWRRVRDPWGILVAEAMRQQTQVARVIDRWPRFLLRFPDPAACAGVPAAEVLREWAGLGYNRRALNLHRAAVAIVADHGGAVPDDLDALLALPGVGPYTARAVRAFAHEQPAAPVDTNIGRVLARVVGRRLSPGEAQQLADALVGADVWAWNQGLMELGALVCTKRSPDCRRGPVASWCDWRGHGPDPADGSAAVGRPQSRFEGSDRQLRGRLVDALRRAPVGEADLAAAMGCDDEARCRRVLARLVADGLVVETEALVVLAGDPVSSGR